MLEMENYPWAVGRSEAVDPLLIIQITAVDGRGRVIGVPISKTYPDASPDIQRLHMCLLNNCRAWYYFENANDECVDCL